MMIEDERQRDRENNESGQDSFTDRTGDYSVNQKREEQSRFRRDHVDVNRTNEVTLLALEDQITIRALSAHFEWRFIKRSQSAARALESYPVAKESSGSNSIHCKTDPSTARFGSKEVSGILKLGPVAERRCLNKLSIVSSSLDRIARKFRRPRRAVESIESVR